MWQTIQYSDRKVYLAEATPVLLEAPRVRGTESSHLSYFPMLCSTGFTLNSKVRVIWRHPTPQSPYPKPLKSNGIFFPFRSNGLISPKKRTEGQSNSCAMCPTPLKEAKYLFSPQKRGSSCHSPPARRRTSLERELSSALNPGSQIKSQQGDLLTTAPLQVLFPSLIHTVTDRLPSAPALHPKGIKSVFSSGSVRSPLTPHATKYGLITRNVSDKSI